MFYDKEYKLKFGGRDLIIKTNVAQQAHGSCLVQYGDTSVMGTAVTTDTKSPLDYFPLTVSYEEKFYAAGKILGSRYTRREGKASHQAVLNSRVIDRIIRPLFPQGFKQETQVMSTVLSWDKVNNPVGIGAFAASLSIGMSKIPWSGPIGCVQICRLNNEFILQPTHEQNEAADLKLTLGAVERNGEILINMIESMSNQVSEKDTLEGIRFAYPHLKELIEFQKKIISEIGIEKMAFESVMPDEKISKEIKDIIGNRLESVLDVKSETRGELVSEITKEIVEKLGDKYSDIRTLTDNFFERETDIAMHKLVLDKNERADGRKTDELRELTGKVGVLPQVHGAGFFARGKTQALSVVTLGAPGDKLCFEGMDLIGEKRYMHHYNFPPYCSGEARPLRAPGRREIGHGQLAENALIPVIPEAIDFPYTIRVVTEILSSNGSTSMASTCGCTLALMDAGVPIKKPVAGISIGLMHEQKIPGKESSRNFKLLTDIQGLEDHYGDMDFKVAGTDAGITAIQLDVKVDGLADDVIEQTLQTAKEARTKILKVITDTIPEPRKELSPNAPLILVAKINPEKIGEVIGPKGKNINELIDKYNVTIDIDDSGEVFVTSEGDHEKARQALEAVKSIARDFEIGEIVEGTVVKIMEFGAFVQLNPTTDGMVHISELANKRVAKVEDIVKEGDVVKVKIIGKQGDKIKLSLKAVDKMLK